MSWLLEHGPGQLELLFRAIVFHPSVPILIADDAGACLDASTGAGKLVGLPRDRLVGRRVDELADPAFKPQLSKLWSALLEQEVQEGSLRLAGPDGTAWDVEYSARGSVLPVRHLVVLRQKAAAAQAEGRAAGEDTPSQPLDYALYLLDVNGCIAAWYSGAARIYGYAEAEALGQHVSLLYPAEESPAAGPNRELNRSAGQGHFGHEGWQMRKEGARFWANCITVALRDEGEHLQGFARVVRDFTDRHERDEKLRLSRSRALPVPAQPTIAGIVSGEFDRVRDANDAFLDLLGYSREDLLAGRLYWPDLTPREYALLDDLAHEEALRFGACTPYEKELIHKEGTRVPVLVAAAVLKLSPFRWIAFVQDLGARNAIENVWETTAEPQQNFVEMVGSSAGLKRIQRQIELVAPTDANVLILGETGTGKELVARAIHQLSPRRNLPFVILNCAAIPTGLLESELFGYEKGAFTGALGQKIGRFEMAHRGTLFLDEVGDIPLELQPKLLRALQEKSFERLGGTRTIPIDVRLIAATNRNLTQMMGDKLFRSDLYYRLKVFPITTPPLRDHPEDIPVLARYFTRKYATAMNRKIEKIPSETMRTLTSWHWPGNVRELENFIERSVILSQGTTLRAPLADIRVDAATSSGSDSLERIEKEHVIRVLRETGGVISRAATRLGMPRTTLNALMRKLGVSRRDL
ncbi:MAG: sigma 54-interacting transcriptional regulator [Bryobacterales bacterium]|nr:sigma 54-interacting transcriptional regulator [Bryobacterales bacterium]